MRNSGFNSRKGVLIYGYDSEKWPLEQAMIAFEILASKRVNLSNFEVSKFSGLMHPIHEKGKVFAWEIY